MCLDYSLLNFPPPLHITNSAQDLLRIDRWMRMTNCCRMLAVSWIFYMWTIPGVICTRSDTNTAPLTLTVMKPCQVRSDAMPHLRSNTQLTLMFLPIGSTDCQFYRITLPDLSLESYRRRAVAPWSMARWTLYLDDLVEFAKRLPASKGRNASFAVR